MPITTTATKFLSFLTLVSDGGIIFFAIVFLYYFLSGQMEELWKSRLIKFFSKKALYFSFLVALAATLGSLFYSEIAHFEPCKLCWFQRILMYPLVLLIAMAIHKRDKGISDYIIAMSVIGMVIAGYHYYLQRGGATILPCSAVGYSVSCSQNFTMEFGYVTIPMMSLTAFILIMILMWIYKKANTDKL